MFKEKMKGFILGVVCTGMVVSSVSAFADPVSKAITAVYNDIKIYVDGNLVKTTDEDGKSVAPFIYEGTTYLPVRAVAQALNQPVSWDGNTSSVYIGVNPNGTSLTALEYARADNYVKVYNTDNPMQTALSGDIYSTGIYFSADWTGGELHGIEYNLDGKYERLTGDFGIDDKYKDRDTSCALVIYGDDVELYRTPQTKAGDIVKVDIDIKDVKKLKIAFDLEKGKGAVFLNPILN
ncbi:NPCBM/NEW2 domain [Mycobacterium tuberculosis]|nr:NPCBM/NEW2 domain [Mycobacterium tuberculosis]